MGLGCKYCNGEKELISRIEDEFGIAKRVYLGIHEGALEVETYANLDSVNADVEIFFCPMCGRKF